MTDRAAWWAPANGFQPRSEPRVHLATRKIHASQRSGKPQTPIATRSARSHASIRGGCAKSRRCRSRSACITIRVGNPSGERRHCPAPPQTGGQRCPRVGVGFRPRRGGRERRWSRPSTARIFQALPRVAHRGGTGLGRARQTAGQALWGALCLSCGTSPERIAPESLTRSISDFVHGHISWRTDLLPPNRVTRLTRLPQRGPQLVNASLAHLMGT
jgi:hypothetical protein